MLIKSVVIKILFVAFYLVFILANLALADIDTRPIIALREDDCRNTWRTPYPEFGGLSALEYGKLKRIPITWAIITSLSDGQGPLTWAELKDYLDTAGGEAASHSVTHNALPSQQSYIDEIIESKQAIDSHLGPEYICKTFLQPGGWTDDAYVNRFSKLDNPIGHSLKENYSQSMSYLAPGWQIGNIYYRHGIIPSYSIDYSSSLSMESMLSTLDIVASTPGLIFTITCHGIQQAGGTTSYAVPVDIMKAFLDKIASLRDEGKIRLMGLDEAYNTQIPRNINKIPDSGFEVCKPGMLNPVGPWKLVNGSVIATDNVYTGSKCALIAGSNSKAESGALLIEPGRFRLSWYQQAEQGYANYPLKLQIPNWSQPSSTTLRNLVNYNTYYNSAFGIWERKTALICVKDQLPTVTVDFITSSGSAYRIDDVSLINEPVDPNISVSELACNPSPLGCLLSWNTPNDSSVLDIDCRYGTKAHPLNLTEGVSAGIQKASPGLRQENFVSINWADPNIYAIYFSAFALRENGAAEPDINYVLVDKTAPIVSSSDIINMPSGEVRAAWSAIDEDSYVYSSQYAVGTSIGSANIIDWTSTNDFSADLTNLPSGRALYFSVKSQNPFGFWSNIQTTEFIHIIGSSGEGGISGVLIYPDETKVTVTGIVSAVFSNKCYIEQPNRARGIQIMGDLDVTEGQEITVTGTLTTIAGERVIVLD